MGIHIVLMRIRVVGLVKLKPMKKIFVVTIFLLLTITGCASNQRSNTLNSWVGARLEQLISSWGPPTNSYSINETTTLSYETSRMIYFNGRPIHMSCATTFTATRGYITYWRYSGNDC